jgi:hypothetical protein
VSALSEMMLAIVHLLGMYVADPFGSQRRLEVKNRYRQQFNIVLRRTSQLPLLARRQALARLHPLDQGGLGVADGPAVCGELRTPKGAD